MRKDAGSDTANVREPPAVIRPGEFIDARRLAAVMGVSTTTIKRWTAAGMPSETWGMKRTRRFQVSEVIAWARAREAAAGGGRERERR
jgi:phage terminase Nu1 subunit (DNA packaging protein)